MIIAEINNVPSWVNRITLVVGRPLPVYPDQRTSSDYRHVGLVPIAVPAARAERFVETISLESRFKDHIEWCLRGALDGFESARLDHLAQPFLAGLRAKARPDFLG
jgi:hypothetical protein